jgi:NADPH-dependent 2,4-dienoyl-CoA reductase/sulfur reductase-like enzyme
VFVLRTIPDSNQIKQWITDHNAKSATVIGAAWAGLEVAEALHGRGLKVNVLELAPQVLGDPPSVRLSSVLISGCGLPQVMPLMDEEMTIPLKMRMLNNGVNLVTGEGVAAIHPGDDGCALKVLTSKGTSIPSGTLHDSLPL